MAGLLAAVLLCCPASCIYQYVSLHAGKGGYGVVYRGLYKDQLVAVKVRRRVASAFRFLLRR